VSTTIYWNDACVVESVYLGVYGFVLVAGFTVSDAVYGKSTLTILNGFIAGLDRVKGDVLDFTINFDAGDPATMTVMVIGTAPPPEVIIPPAPPDEQAVVYGELNGDGRVTAADATLVLRVAAGLIDLSEKAEAADVNDDGRITAVDATLILRRAAKPASVILTLDTYSHVLPDMQEKAAEKLEDMLFSGRHTETTESDVRTLYRLL
jgi:hypothetical protein